MNRLLQLRSCRALRELKGQQPLTDLEYQRLAQLAEDCPLAGEHFDEVSWLYPLRIPLEPKVRILDAEMGIVSVLVILNRNQFVGLIGDHELEEIYQANPGGFLFCVGELEKKIKDTIIFWNLRPRGWKIYSISADDKELLRNERQKKKYDKKCN